MTPTPAARMKLTKDRRTALADLLDAVVGEEGDRLSPKRPTLSVADVTDLRELAKALRTDGNFTADASERDAERRARIASALDACDDAETTPVLAEDIRWLLDGSSGL